VTPTSSIIPFPNQKYAFNTDNLRHGDRHDVRLGLQRVAGQGDDALFIGCLREQAWRVSDDYVVLGSVLFTCLPPPSSCPQANKGTVHAHFTAKIGKHDVSGYTLTDSSKIVLVFRGTNAFGQLVDEAVASSPVNYPYPATAKSLKVVKV